MAWLSAETREARSSLLLKDMSAAEQLFSQNQVHLVVNALKASPTLRSISSSPVTHCPDGFIWLINLTSLTPLLQILAGFLKEAVP